MSVVVERASEIPSARFYVLCQDKFMSGWGYAEGKVNVCVFPCESWEEAKRVLERCERRGEMIRCRVNGSKPRLRPHWLVSLFSRDDASAFYGGDVR